MFRTFVLALTMLEVFILSGCASSTVRLDSQGGVLVNRTSFLRRGVYAVNVDRLPDGTASIVLNGEEKAMSGQLAMMGAAIGALLLGPGGALAGGAAGAATEVLEGAAGSVGEHGIAPDGSETPEVGPGAVLEDQDVQIPQPFGERRSESILAYSSPWGPIEDSVLGMAGSVP